MTLWSAVFIVLGIFAVGLPGRSQDSARSGQNQLDNTAVIQLIQAGLSEDLIVSSINSMPGKYVTSADGLIALKAALASDKVITAILLRNPPRATQPPAAGTAVKEPGGDTVRQQLLPSSPSRQIDISHATPVAPRVYLQAASKGTNRNAARDQAMEMSKDMEKDCAGIQVTINAQTADYTILLNHIEVGLLVRDNQFQVANRQGDLISRTKEGGSIAGGMKRACALILEDWAKTSGVASNNGEAARPSNYSPPAAAAASAAPAPLTSSPTPVASTASATATTGTAKPLAFHLAITADAGLAESLNYQVDSQTLTYWQIRPGPTLTLDARSKVVLYVDNTRATEHLRITLNGAEVKPSWVRNGERGLKATIQNH